MDLVKADCFGSVFITPVGFIGFGLGAAALLVYAWTRTGTAVLLQAWAALAGAAAVLLVLRFWQTGSLEWGAGDWLPLLMGYLVAAAVATLLTAATSAALWTLLPRLPRGGHIALAAAAFVVAAAWSVVSADFIWSLNYAVLGP